MRIYYVKTLRKEKRRCKRGLIEDRRQGVGVEPGEFQEKGERNPFG